MESSCKNSCSVIQYYKGTETETNNAEIANSSNFESQNAVEQELKEILPDSSESKLKKFNFNQIFNHEDNRGEISVNYNIDDLKSENFNINLDHSSLNESKKTIKTEIFNNDEKESKIIEMGLDVKLNLDSATPKIVDNADENSVVDDKKDIRHVKEENSDFDISETKQFTRGRKRKLSSTTIDNESVSATNTEDAEGNDESLDSDLECNEENDKPRRRGRRKGKKTSEVIPSHLSSDMVLGYKMLVRFLETPQFSAFHKPFKKNTGAEDLKITCLNQIKKKFEDNSYKMISEFVNDVREMLTNIYESRNSVSIKRALRLEQVLEQRIAQLPNYLRPQCALVLPPDEISNSHNKIRISKGGGFVSLLLEKTEKQRYEKNKEKRKLLAEERKQLKEEQNKDVQDWEKNILLKDFEEEIKSMWELPAIGHFIHLCADILNIGEVAQFEVERMLLMPQCSDTLDLIMTALLTNSLMRAKLDRTPSMPYSIWSPLVRTRVMSWYRTWHKEGKNEQKLFEEIGIEPEFWHILGPDINPLDYYYFHEISLLQRVWILKTLCDVDFIRKKTVHDNIRAQTLDELNPVYLGIDRHGNRYIQLKQFCSSDIRIYRESSKLVGDITLSEFVENFEGFEHREGPITVDKVFRDIWELNVKPEVKIRKKKIAKAKKQKNWNAKVVLDSFEKKNLRRSARAKQKTYVDWSDSDQSDTDLITLKKKLARPDVESLYRPFSDKEFISLSVFRLPRDKVTKPTPKKSGYVKKTEDSNKNDSMPSDKNVKTEPDEIKEDNKPSACDDEQSDSLDAKQMQDIQTDFEKTFQNDDMNGDEFDLEAKLSDFKLDKVSNDVKFTVKNLEDLKMVFKKGSTLEEGSEKQVKSEEASSCKDGDADEKPNLRDKEYDSLYKYTVPNHLKPDSSKFYLVVDSVEGLRQLISKFGSHENDLEIITRSTKSKKKISHSNTSCEVELIERLQNLLLELEPWEIDFMKSHRSNKEKMYKEYMNFINRPADFVHPNEGYWMKTYEEPTATTSSSTSTTTTTTTTTADSSVGNGDKGNGKDVVASTSESADANQDDSLDCLVLRRRTRVTRLQIQPEDNDIDEDFDDDDYESNESDDNWVMPTPKRKSKKESTVRTPKFPRRSTGRKAKSSSLEKTDSSTNTGEKSQNTSPEKTKKALFWGPRSSDPSEDLNWEKNRQKILEQHNSPVKKVLFKSEEISHDMSELEKALQKSETLPTSVITASPKRLTTPIPGNKKPYFSSAQLKAMENQAKQGMLEDTEHYLVKGIAKKSPSVINSAQQTELKNTATSMTSDLLLMDSGNKPQVKIQTYGRINNATLKQSVVRTPQAVNRSRQPPPKQMAVQVANRIETSSASIQQPVKLATQVREHNQSLVNPINSQIIKNIKFFKLGSPGNAFQQKSIGQVHIQIQQPSEQISQKTNTTSVANVRMQQPLQWQPKVIAVQSVSQQGKVVQQQLQTQSQVQIQGQPQVQLQNQSQVQGQGQVQQVIHLEPQKWTAMQQPIQVPAEKLGTVQQMVISQAQTSSGTPNPDNDLYITDGKLLIKFDNNFIHQYLSKDKVVALNVNDKLDLKKPLLIVKPKTDSNASVSQTQGQPQAQAQGESSTNQQNVLVFNKPQTVQQTVVPSSVHNFVIPGNYIVKDENQGSSQSGQQTVKIVQQAPTYIIQQKPVAGKNSQPQIIKIITSQPMSSNQSLILSPANISGGSQVIRPITQTVVASDQQSKSPTTLRFMRPHITTSNSQSKISTVQNPIIVNNIVQIQGQEIDASKSQVVGSRIVSTAVPAVRMVTPVQAQHFVPSGNVTQTVKFGAQPLKVVVTSSQSQVQTHTVVSSVTLNTQAVRPTSVNTVRLAASGQHQGVLAMTNSKLQTVVSTTTVSTLPLRVVTSTQSQQTQPPTVVANISPQTGISTQDVTTQALRLLTSAQPTQVQTQTVVASMNLNQVRMATSSTQAVRLATVGQSQPVKLIANNSVGPRIIRNGPPGKATVITSVPQSPATTTNVRPSTVGQPVRLQTVVQSTGTSGDGTLQSR